MLNYLIKAQFHSISKIQNWAVLIKIHDNQFQLRAEKCHDCGEPIIGTCYTLNDKNYCEEHYRAKCDNCPKCGEQIIGHMVRTSSAAFHPGM